MERYLDPRSDIVFKRIFGEHKDLTMSFLNALLPLRREQQITDIEYLNAEMVPVAPGMRNSLVDVRCTDNRGWQFFVEMQMFWSVGFFKRMLYNASKVYSRQEVTKKKPYSALKPVYGLAILNDTFDSKTKKFYHHFELLNRSNPDEKMPDMEFVFVELEKFKPVSMRDRKMAVLWLRFLKETEGEHESMPEEMTENKEINKALEICKAGAYSKEEMEHYERFEDAVVSYYTLIDDAESRGIEKGIEQGIEKGIEMERAEFVKSLHGEGVPIDKIAIYTKLSEERVAEILCG